MGDSTLTIQQAGYLSDLIRGVETGARLEWYPEGADNDAKHTDYTLRAFTNPDGSLYDFNADIRDAYVWCSGIMERFFQVRKVMTALENAIHGTDGHDKPMALIRP